MIATFTGNPVISTYSQTNVKSKEKIQEHYSELTTLIHQILKQNVLLLSGDMNAQVGPILGKHHKTNRNGELLCERQHPTNLINLCTKDLVRNGHSCMSMVPKRN